MTEEPVITLVDRADRPVSTWERVGTSWLPRTVQSGRSRRRHGDKEALTHPEVLTDPDARPAFRGVTTGRRNMLNSGIEGDHTYQALGPKRPNIPMSILGPILDHLANAGIYRMDTEVIWDLISDRRRMS